MHAENFKFFIEYYILIFYSNKLTEFDAQFNWIKKSSRTKILLHFKWQID